MGTYLVVLKFHSIESEWSYFYFTLPYSEKTTIDYDVERYVNEHQVFTSDVDTYAIFSVIYLPE